MTTRNHPGVYAPPPLIYAAVFFLSIFLQRFFPLTIALTSNEVATATGWIFISLGIFFSFPALWRFAVSHNSVITVKPANSLQTKGIYSITRNPMYLGLLLTYTGIAFLKGNAWSFILIPLLNAIVQLYVIRREENYLLRVFGERFKDYKKTVRRWI